MRTPAFKKRIHYRLGNGFDGYCRDCGNVKQQPKLFGQGFLNCEILGVGTKKGACVQPDYTCNMFWKKDIEIEEEQNGKG